MRNLLPAMASGLAGCVVAVVLVLTGVVVPPARETPRAPAEPQAPTPVPDSARDDTELRGLRSELRALRAEVEAAHADLRKGREAPPKVEAPQGAPAADPIAQTSEELLWMRLWVRGIKPLVYREAVERMLIAARKLSQIHRAKGSIEDVTHEQLFGKATTEMGGPVFWLPDDFALLITGKTRGEIELVSDPATPRLKLFIDLESHPGQTWNKVIDGVTPEKDGDGSERTKAMARAAAVAAEARAGAGALKDRARVVHMRTQKAPTSLEDLGVGETELSGSYLTASDYSISGTVEEWVVTVRGVFSDEPHDLVLTVNLSTGQASFNR